MKNTHHAVRSFVRYVARFKRAFLLTCAVFAVADTFIALVPWAVGQLTSALTTGSSSVTFWTMALILSSVGHDITWRTGEILYLRLLNGRSNRYDDIVFRAIINRDYAYFTDKFSGKVGSYATTLGREFRELLENFCYDYIDLIVRLPVITAIMFTVNLYTGAIFAVSLAAMFAVGRKLATLAAKAERAATDARSNMDGYIVDTIANFVSVKAFGKSGREARYIYGRRDAVITAANKSQKQDIIFWGVMSLFVRWVIWPSTIILNVYLFVHHEISVAQITTFLSAIVLFAQFIWEIIWNVSQLTIRLARTEEAYQYLFGAHDIAVHIEQKDEPAQAHVPFENQLEFRAANFAYPDKPDTAVLEDISLTIRQGEKIGIVGLSGGGKSTFAKLLLGYYPLPENMLYVDDVPTDNGKLAHSVAYVPQDTSLFHRSIRDNIAYSKPDASDEEIIAAAKHAQAHEFIEALPHGYDTLVGERGIKLSGGQRQRVAIARAILKDAPILVLDEATSALDSHSEILIQKALDELMKHRTSIVVAHRLSTIHKMDRIIVLDKGKIAEAGTHAELLQANGIYAQLWQHQSGGFIEE